MRHRLRVLARAWWGIAMGGALAASSTRAAADDATPVPTTAPAAEPAPQDPAREEAKQHFEKGVALLQSRAFDAALTEFERSRAALPTRSATENAAVCLREIGRSDEAWEMFGHVLVDFGELPDDVRARVLEQQKALEPKLGAVAIESGPKDASVSIDGRPRGTLPLAEPIRVSVGAHTVRVHLEGYVPFVQGIDVAPRLTVKLQPKLEVLARAGRLGVSERRGRALDVVIDGVVVGRTPWEGALEPGDHAVWLSGTATLGTAPTRGRVLIGQRSELVLNAIELDGTLRVRVTPPDAVVTIDGVVVGRGAWEGRLPPGPVSVAVSARGYQSDTRSVNVGGDARADVDVVLIPERPVEAPAEAKGALEIAVRGAVAIAPNVLAQPCEDLCARTVGVGAHVEGSAQYRFGQGFGVGASAGYLRFSQEDAERPLELAPSGLPAQRAFAAESTALSGFTVSALGSYRLGDSPFLSFDLGAGAFFGALTDTRSIRSTDSTGASFVIGPYDASGTLVGLVVEPSARFGFVPAGPVEVSVGAGGLILVPLERPTFAYAAAVPAGADGAAHLGETDIVSSVIAAFSASLAVGLRL